MATALDPAPDGPDLAPFHLSADHAPMMLWRTDVDGACDFVNRPWRQFTGRSPAQELGLGWAEGIHPEDRARCLAAFRAALAARHPFTLDLRLRRHDGAWRWMQFSGHPRAAGRFAGYLGSCIDIDEMRQGLEERRRMLAEREALLAELHHRVKNNAQATTSFLALQAGRAEDRRVAQALRDAATRVMLSSLVQDRMFRLAGAAAVDVGPEVTATARQAAAVAGRRDVALEARSEAALVVPVSRATPLVHIVNELVVNALRHGFPGGRAGRVAVTVRRRPQAPDLGEILVEDDGIGTPEAVLRQAPRRCLGLHLAQRLARQARASLRLESAGPEGGTRATVTFPAA